jgi:hypothetical protein
VSLAVTVTWFPLLLAELLCAGHENAKKSAKMSSYMFLKFKGLKNAAGIRNLVPDKTANCVRSASYIFLGSVSIDSGSLYQLPKPGISRRRLCSLLKPDCTSSPISKTNV